VDKIELELVLENWGRWKRNLATGLGWKNSTIEAQIIRGEIFGDGCIHGGKNLELKNGVTFPDDEASQTVERLVRNMVENNRELAAVLMAKYVWQWSVQKISQECGKSRFKIDQDLKSAQGIIKTLIEYSQG